jgi:hypothetical protein
MGYSFNPLRCWISSTFFSNNASNWMFSWSSTGVEEDWAGLGAGAAECFIYIWTPFLVWFAAGCWAALGLVWEELVYSVDSSYIPKFLFILLYISCSRANPARAAVCSFVERSSSSFWAYYSAIRSFGSIWVRVGASSFPGKVFENAKTAMSSSSVFLGYFETFSISDVTSEILLPLEII